MEQLVKNLKPLFYLGETHIVTETARNEIMSDGKPVVTMNMVLDTPAPYDI